MHHHTLFLSWWFSFSPSSSHSILLLTDNASLDRQTQTTPTQPQVRARTVTQTQIHAHKDIHKATIKHAWITDLKKKNIPIRKLFHDNQRHTDTMHASKLSACDSPSHVPMHVRQNAWLPSQSTVTTLSQVRGSQQMLHSCNEKHLSVQLLRFLSQKVL